MGGTVTTFSVIPEVIGFTIVAGVAPILGLYTSIAFLLITSFLGGRPAMVSAGAGSMAVVVASLIRNYDISYLFAAVLLAGIIQLILGAFRVGNLMRFVPAAVIAGFVDALAIIIFKSQITSCMENLGATTASAVLTLIFVAVGIVIVYLFPRITRAFPSTLFSIIIVTIIWIIIRAISGGSFQIAAIGDLGNFAVVMPTIAFPNVPLNFEILKVVAPYSISLAFVGLLETLMTNQVVDEMTGTESNKNKECRAQGICNMACGFIGAMPGCAMIGQAIANVSSGGRGRLSTFVAGCFLLALLIFGSAVLGAIPLAALIAVMITVSIATFDWKNLKAILASFKSLLGPAKNKDGILSSLVTILTVVVVVATDNLAYGVAAGLVLHGLFNLSFSVRQHQKHRA